MFQGMRVLLLPGWLNSGPAHWQTRWEALHGFERVTQHDWDQPRRGDWMTRLQDVMLDCPLATVLAAHSLGCHLVAAWATHSPQRKQVVAALLAASPDLQREDLPPALAGWRGSPTQALPFPCLLASARDDPFCGMAHSRRLAAQWGAELWDLGPRGHANADSGRGDWPAGLARLHAIACAGR